MSEMEQVLQQDLLRAPHALAPFIGSKVEVTYKDTSRLYQPFNGEPYFQFPVLPYVSVSGILVSASFDSVVLNNPIERRPRVISEVKSIRSSTIYTGTESVQLEGNVMYSTLRGEFHRLTLLDDPKRGHQKDQADFLPVVENRLS